MRPRHAFTLVELLVVIGIIALLISILIPSLTNARQAAQRTVCMSKLHQIMIGAQMHLIDHKGYFPMVGVLPAMEPQNLEDNYSSKYDYFSYEFAGLHRMIAPITISLATELAAKQARDVLSNTNVGQAETDSRGFIQYFLCPSQAGSVDELPQLPMLWMGKLPFPIWYTQAQSYIYNEAALGYDDTMNRGRGQFARIHQPARTFFAADGLMSAINNPRYPYANGRGMSTLYNLAPDAPITMADALAGNTKAGDPQNFDRLRHRGKINIAFCDGHVETLPIAANDLSSVFLIAP